MCSVVLRQTENCFARLSVTQSVSESAQSKSLGSFEFSERYLLVILDFMTHFIKNEFCRKGSSLLIMTLVSKFVICSTLL